MAATTTTMMTPYRGTLPLCAATPPRMAAVSPGITNPTKSASSARTTRPTTVRMTHGDACRIGSRMPLMGGRPGRISVRTCRSPGSPMSVEAVRSPTQAVSDRGPDGSGDAEADDAGDAGDQTVDGERGEGTGLEVADQEPHRQVGGDTGDDHADDDLTVDVIPGGTGEGRELEHAGGQDDRRREQEGESGGVLVGQATGQPADHGGAGAADTREQRRNLPQPDVHPVAVAEAGQAVVRLDRGGDLLTGSRPGSGRGVRLGPDLLRGDRDPAAQAFAGQQDQAVDREEHGRRQRLGEDRAQRVVEHQAGEPDRDRG